MGGQRDDFVSQSRLIDAQGDEAERLAEAALRPKTLADFVGQDTVKTQLSLVLQAAKRRGETPDHILLAGPPGLGKTTLAMIVAAEMHTSLRLTSGPAISHAGDLAAILSSLQEGDVLFIDEIHRLARPAEEMLYLAMEDFRVDVVVGKGPGATSIPLSLPRFTLVGATTRAGLLPGPLRDRFGFTAHMEPYEATDLARIVQRSAVLLEAKISQTAAEEVARRSRGTPRVANRLLRRVIDFSLVNNHAECDLQAVRDTLRLFEVDEMGLDRLDRDVLRAIVERFRGGPVGAGSLAVSVGEEKETIEEIVEPFLVRVGLLARTQRGRVITPKGYQHLGLPVPGENPEENKLFSLS